MVQENFPSPGADEANLRTIFGQGETVIPDGEPVQIHMGDIPPPGSERAWKIHVANDQSDDLGTFSITWDGAADLLLTYSTPTGCFVGVTLSAASPEGQLSWDENGKISKMGAVELSSPNNPPQPEDTDLTTSLVFPGDGIEERMRRTDGVHFAIICEQTGDKPLTTLLEAQLTTL